jgi:hypothetical protein
MLGDGGGLCNEGEGFVEKFNCGKAAFACHEGVGFGVDQQGRDPLVLPDREGEVEDGLFGEVGALPGGSVEDD